MLTKVELQVLSAHAPHGTHARYNAHRLKDEEPCDRCRDGEARYRAKLRAKRHADPERIARSRRDAVFASRTRTLRVQDDKELEDDEDEAENDEEEYEPDDAPPAGSHAANLAQTWETIGKLPLFRFNGKPPGTLRQPRRSRITGIASPTSEDPGTRLQAITAKLNTRRPRGSEAVKLLVEAAPYLTGGVTALAQYAEARGCHPDDVVAAERIVVGKGRG